MVDTTSQTPEEEFLSAAVAEFARYKRLAEKAFDQLNDADFFYTPGDESNSIYVIVKHMAGNMRSRWTDFLTTDGEKPDRDRDREFLTEDANRDQMIAAWEQGWGCLFEALADLDESDLLRTVRIRGQRQTVVQAILRQLTHYAHHIGQIIYVGKHLKGEGWKSLSIPKGRSADYLSG